MCTVLFARKFVCIAIRNCFALVRINYAPRGEGQIGREREKDARARKNSVLPHAILWPKACLFTDLLRLVS